MRRVLIPDLHISEEAPSRWVNPCLANEAACGKHRFIIYKMHEYGIDEFAAEHDTVENQMNKIHCYEH
jgi:hypothetical protein